MTRRSWLFIVIGLVVLGIVAAGLTQARDRAVDVDEADDVGVAFHERADAFESEVADRVSDAAADASTSADYAVLREVAVDALEDLPSLPDVPARGAENSQEYASAQAREQRLGEPLEELQAALDDAIPGMTFVEAARGALEVRPDELIGAETFASGAPIRTGLIPTLQQTRAEFLATSVPEDASDAASAVEGALDHVLNEAEILAATLDSGQGYSFEYGQRYGVAENRVEAYAERLRRSVGAAVTATTNSAETGTDPDAITPTAAPS